MRQLDRKHMRLPITFHRTFIPELHYVAALLQYAASSNTGTEQEISKKTGIPTGKSDGKVPAILGYGSGMGLITIQPTPEAGKKRIELTDFGRTVLLEDPQLGESLTQWLAHLQLCRRFGGAQIWYLTFGRSLAFLGMEFSMGDLEEFLVRECGKRNRSVIGPLIRTYQEVAGLKEVSAIKEEMGLLKRSSAPILNGYSNGYAAFFLSLWESHFPNESQVTVDDFEAETFWRAICGWDIRQRETVFDMFEQRGAIDIDKRMLPWVLMRKAPSKQFWVNSYDDLI